MASAYPGRLRLPFVVDNGDLLDSLVLPRGEVVVDGDGVLRIGDNVTAGGRLIGRRDILSPKDFGAKGGGVNDTLAITLAINASAALGLPLDGGLTQYSVSGNLLFTGLSGVAIVMLRVKQMSPNLATRRTLYFNNCQKLRLDWIEVDRNGNGAEGGLTTAAGIWIEGGSGHRCAHLEAYGNGKGSGIYIGNTSDSSYHDLWGHDIAFDDPGATDDRVHGVWANGNTDCVFAGLRAHDLTGNATGRNFPTAWTRGVASSANNRCTFMGFAIRNVDQGLDVTGGGGNVDCVFDGGTIDQVSLFGVKLANSAVRCTVANMTVNGSGLAGFVASGPAETGLANITMDCQFINCISRNPGSVGSFAGTKAGFRVMQAAFNQDYPKGIRFISCRAIDDQGSPTMQFGYHCETPYDGASKKLNEVNDCTSIGHSTAATFGFAYWGACATGVADQNIANAAWAAINFEGADVFDGAALHDPVMNNNQISTPAGGLYLVNFKVQFAPNATGVRKVRILRTGTPITGAEFSVPAVSGDATTVSGSLVLPFVDAANASLEAYQTSGGALAVVRAASLFSMNLVKAV